MNGKEHDPEDCNVQLGAIYLNYNEVVNTS